MPAPEAHRVALIQFGGTVQVREEHREHRAVPHLDTVLQDLRYALRLLRKAPGLTATAALTIAFGIGLSTTVYTIYNSVAVRLFPVKDPGSVVRLTPWYRDRSSDDRFTLREFDYVREHSEPFSGVIAATAPTKVQSQEYAGSDAELVQAQLIADNYFSMLGVTVQPGRSRFYSS